MSGLYLLLLLAIWLGLGYGGYRLWLSNEPQWKDKKQLYIAIGATAVAVWVLWPFWEVAGKKMYYDTEVKKLCAKDGGVKVYETVKLSPEKFDKYGVVRIPSKQDTKPSDDYYYVSDNEYLRTDNPKLTRLRTQIIRHSDGKVLGESIRYTRGGGDLPGPWYGSSFICPPISKDRLGLESSIFLRGNEK